MTKRAKAGQAKKGAPGAAKAAAKAAADGFYRPFSTLARPAKEQKAAAAPAAPGSGKPEAAAPARAGAPPPPAAAPKRPAAAAGDAPPRMVDPETFAIYMSGVRALEDRASRIPTTSSRIERAARAAPPAVDPDADARARMRSLVTEGIRFETTDNGARVEGRRLDVDPRELRRLRRARCPVDATLDVRALGRDEARAAVEAFVRKRAEGGDQIVAVLHGEGASSAAPRVLRGELAAWLSQGHAARHVAAFATAPEPDGAEGDAGGEAARGGVSGGVGAESLLVLLAR